MFRANEGPPLSAAAVMSYLRFELKLQIPGSAIGGYRFFNIGQVLLTMYLTLEDVVNTFLLGQVKKKLKSTKIVTEFFLRG